VTGVTKSIAQRFAANIAASRDDQRSVLA